ncbi:MAG: hypothetical protein JO266_02920 [Acidobacteria bacterium]|nr:hypothetical protein [Acidobacteriota bacterium]
MTRIKLHDMRALVLLVPVDRRDDQTRNVATVHGKRDPLDRDQGRVRTKGSLMCLGTRPAITTLSIPRL